MQFFASVGVDTCIGAIAGIISKNLRAAIQRSIDNAIQVFCRDGPISIKSHSYFLISTAICR